MADFVLPDGKTLEALSQRFIGRGSGSGRDRVLLIHGRVTI